MGIFFSCSAKFIFRNIEPEPSQPKTDIAAKKEDTGEPSKKLVCRNQSCACHDKLKMQTSLEQGVVIRENHMEDAEFRRSLVYERVTHFEELIRISKSRATKSLTDFQIVDENSDGVDGLQIQAEVSKEEDVDSCDGQKIEEVEPHIGDDDDLATVVPCLKDIINELVTNEAIYVQTLGQGIKNYVTPMDNPDVPEDIRADKSKIFGNIVDIYQMHANKFYPGLVSCGLDVLKISAMFNTLIANDDFYCYILFTLNRDQAVLLSDTHFQFFQDLQKATDGDKLGVGSFLLQPVQRLPRYQLLLNEVTKELMKSREKIDIRKYVGAICKTEKQIVRLLMLINESLGINEIASSGLPIDLFAIGKVRKIGEFTMYDYKRRRRYRGKLFYFDQCLVYTESIHHKLEYRGHYKIQEFGIANYDANEKISLVGDTLGGHRMNFRANISQLEEWYEILRDIIRERCSSGDAETVGKDEK